MAASSAAELVALGAVIPFLSVISEPERLWQQPLVKELGYQLGFDRASQLLLPATLLFATTAVVAGLVRISNLWLNGRLSAAVGSDLSCEAYKRTLYQPYSLHVQMNSAELITGSTKGIGRTVVALNSLLQLVTSALVAAGLLAGLLFIDAPVALGAAALFVSAYLILAIRVRSPLRRNGQKIAEASRQQLRALQEGLGAIREVLLDGNQQTYLQIYRHADRPQRQLQAENLFLGSFPRYALEAMGMVLIALFGGMLVLQKGGGGPVIPLLGALALGAQRLLPALQQVYGGWASWKSFNADIQGVLEMLDRPLPPETKIVAALKLRKSICMEAVHFSYGPQQQEVLRGINLVIHQGERIGIIGSTGSGKSTSVDVLMGLLKPSLGRLLIDDNDVFDIRHPERLAAWRAAIAHVPQSIYLADSTIAENIAFGVPRNRIDIKRVKQAAEQAHIHDFIEEKSEGYESYVGERGIKLSGGQRQRIGIARALYKKAQVLILDEATSALDSDTELAVMSVINGLSKDLTVIIVAHRQSTLSCCDKIVRIKSGIIESEFKPMDNKRG